MLQGPIPNLCLASQKDSIFLFRQVPNVFIICKKKKIVSIRTGLFQTIQKTNEKRENIRMIKYKDI